MPVGAEFTTGTIKQKNVTIQVDLEGVIKG